MKEEVEVYLDVETSSLDADSGMVVAVGFAEGDREPDIMLVKSFEDEKAVISSIFGKIEDRKIVTFNGTNFDIPFLIARGLKYDLCPPNIEMIDLYRWARRFLRLQSRRFHDICVFYNIPHEEISGKEVNELFIKAVSGNNSARERIATHLIQDIEALRTFHKKIKPLLTDYRVPDDLSGYRM
jgi:uncharacterized protein YprB with RNaseH-like and TPR domain